MVQATQGYVEKEFPRVEGKIFWTFLNFLQL